MNSCNVKNGGITYAEVQHIRVESRTTHICQERLGSLIFVLVIRFTRYVTGQFGNAPNEDKLRGGGGAISQPAENLHGIFIGPVMDDET